MWVATLIHAVHSAFLQAALPTVTTQNAWHTYLGGECGALTVMGYAVLAFILWRSGRSAVSAAEDVVQVDTADPPV